jgi:hypothetical protein
MSIKSFFLDLVHHIAALPGEAIAFLKSPKFAEVEQRIAQYTAEAYPIVAKIAAMAPNKTMDEIVKAYGEYAIPLADDAKNANPGYLLLNLATMVLKGLHSTAFTTELQAAIQTALVLFKGTASA